MWRRVSNWVLEAAAVFAKDGRCELRTRYALNTLALFAVTTLLVTSLCLGPLGASPDTRQVLPVLLWVILLFAVSAGLPRAFVQEEDTGTATALRLAATPSAVFCGKQALGLVLVFALELLVTPLFIGLLQVPVERPGLLVLSLAVGGYGLATASTLIASIISQARGQSTLFAVLAFPVILPLLVMAVILTGEAFGGDPGGIALGQLLLYDGVLTVAGYMLFPAVWSPT